MLVTFGQNRGKKLTETLVEVEGDIKADNKLDRHLKREPKILYYAPTVADMDENISTILYSGNKLEMLVLVDEDLGDVLTRKQQKLFGRKIEDKDDGYFVVCVHPLTQHKIKK